jgi:hypothetical protein
LHGLETENRRERPAGLEDEEMKRTGHEMKEEKNEKK